MKKVFIFFICALFISSVQAKTYTREEVSCNDKDFCTDLSGEPVTGIINDGNAVFNYSIEYKNGLRHGLAKVYYSETGSLNRSTEYDNGVRKITTQYLDNGTVSSKYIYKNDELVEALHYWCNTDKIYEVSDIQNGSHTYYYKSGEKQHTMDTEGNQEFFTKSGEKFAFVNRQGIFCKEKNGEYKKNNKNTGAKSKKMEKILDDLAHHDIKLGGTCSPDDEKEHDFTFLCE